MTDTATHDHPQPGGRQGGREAGADDWCWWMVPCRPGRMQSIYTSSLLTHGESVVCVDDVVRVVESVYSLSYLGSLFASSVQLKGADTMCFLNP